MTKKEIRVVAALLSRGDEVLVQQRSPDKSLPLLWEFPGGKVEPGEVDPVSLARECREELGIEIEVGPRVWQTRHEYPDKIVELLLYRATIVSGEPQPLESHALRWVHREQLGELPFCEADLPILPLLAAGELG